MLIEDENGWTGIENLYNHWDEIEWKKSKSANAVNKELLCNLDRDKIFLSKFIVCPPAYRDVMIAGTGVITSISIGLNLLSGFKQ